MKNFDFNAKFIYFFQLSFVVLMAFGILPREASLITTAVLVGYIFISPVEDSLLLFIASIPLFIALPFIENYDSMTNWRIITLFLFCKWIYDKKNSNFQFVISKQIINYRFLKFKTRDLAFYIPCFIIFAIISLIGAPYPLAGIKKLIFLANIFLLFILVRNVANTEEKIISLMKAIGLSAVITLVIGYFQFISVFFYSLYEFWQYWAQNITTVFYGRNLGELLSVSNTWFSYYQDLPPTLRMFSVFPDSHSFALSIVIALPILLTIAVYWPENISKQARTLRACLLAAFCLLPIIFSGSRGVWASALAALAAGIFYSVKISKKFRPAVFTIALLFLLFPIASFILGKSQEVELRRINSEDATIKSRSVSFERFASVIDADETSNKGRLEIWRDALNSVKGNLFFGVGFGNFPIILSQDVSAAKKGSSAHNIYLDILAEIGIFGLAAFALIFYEILKTAYKVSKSENKIFSFFASMLFIYLFWIAAYGLFDVVLFNDKVLLTFMATVGILYSMKNLEIRN